MGKEKIGLTKGYKHVMCMQAYSHLPQMAKVWTAACLATWPENSHATKSHPQTT